MSARVIRVWGDGMRRVNAAPAIVVGVFALTLAIAVPLGIALRGMIAASLGPSRTAETVAAGVDLDWWQDFQSHAVGLGTTFKPSIIGFAAVLRNLSDLLDHQPLAATVAGAVGAYIIFWIFLAGGILDRYARGRPTRAYGFFGACGMFFFRFLRLGAVAFIAYYLLFVYVHGWLLEDLYTWATREFTVERNAFFVRVALYLLFGALLVALNVVIDYAKVRAVVEDRRSMLGALAASWRFIRQRPVPILALYLLNAFLFVTIAVIYALVAPGARGAGALAWLGFLIGQIYLAARVWVKLLFSASQVAFFQSQLAHAGYIAAPPRVWPESPAAELISRPS